MLEVGTEAQYPGSLSYVVPETRDPRAGTLKVAPSLQQATPTTELKTEDLGFQKDPLSDARVQDFNSMF